MSYDQTALTTLAEIEEQLFFGSVRTACTLAFSLLAITDELSPEIRANVCRRAAGLVAHVEDDRTWVALYEDAVEHGEWAPLEEANTERFDLPPVKQ